jgi:phage shock protein E
MRLTGIVIIALVAISLSAQQVVPENPRIDMVAYLQVADEAAKHRESRRISEGDFIRMSHDPGTVILDARSPEKFAQMHVKGAVNLSFSDMTVESLASLFPDKRTRILIYCNNNFENSEKAFPTKIARASLNLSTYIALYSYGYRNVFELAALLDPATAKIEFEGTEVK